MDARIENRKKRIERNKINLILLVFLGIVLFLSPVSAKFVCGVVNDAQMMQSSWFEVNVTSLSNSDFKTSCEISPDGGKYCCDIESSSEGWNLGEVMQARVIDEERGYIAGPVEVELTSKAYDVFPEMNLLKVINVYEPKKQVYVGNYSWLFFNFSVLNWYNDISFEGEKIENKTFFRDVNFGKNNFEISAGNGLDVFSENVTFLILEDFNFLREMTCVDCSGKKIHRNREVEIHLSLNFSEDVTNYTFREFIPMEWEIIETNGGVLGFGNIGYNVLSWKINGTKFDVSYKLKSPSDGINKFYFASYLSDGFLQEDEVLLYNIIKPINSGGSRKSTEQEEPSVKFDVEFEEMLNIENNKPMVIEEEDIMAAILLDPKTEKLQGFFNLVIGQDSNYNLGFGEKFFEKYLIQTDQTNASIDEMVFEIKVNESKVEEENIKDIKFGGINFNGGFVSLTGNVIRGNGEIKKYSIEASEPLREIFLYGDKVKLNIFERIGGFFRQIFR